MTIQTIKKELSDKKKKTTGKYQFKTVIFFKYNGTKRFLQELSRDLNTSQKSGTGGFGYDPIFSTGRITETFAELSAIEND
jgi:XTP/dITP diphosphohydrolase